MPVIASLLKVLAAALAGVVLALPSSGMTAEPTARESAPKPSAPAKKARKPRVAKPPLPAGGVETQANSNSVTTRYEEVELIPVPPPTPTPAAELTQ